MKEEEIPDYHLFMMCPQLEKTAMRELDGDFYFRNCRPDELEIWKAFPFDSEVVPEEYKDFMDQIIKDSYSREMDTFFKSTLFVCDQHDSPVATCSHWKAYGLFHSIHWLKTLKSHEGKGIGRALVSEIMKQFAKEDYPIFIHTQPGSFRAIKLYSDFGFTLLRGGKLGTRTNDLEKCLPILKEFMPPKAFESLTIVDTPQTLIKELEMEKTIQF